ncbi:TPA: transposase [Bacillus anthracis]|uniref:IS66 family transposase n=1 Tax=Bacillus cereus group TaxID=86661 RepID=UPI0009B546DB|nr:transposase [Bacillus cereus]MBJ8058012.1 transposase [Bacillus cereus]HDR7436577.1 transposase [Bacillus anthracis]
MFIYTDETNFQVLLEQGRDTTKKSYLWLYRTGRLSFDNQPTRAGKHPNRFLLALKYIYSHNILYFVYNCK